MASDALPRVNCNLELGAGSRVGEIPETRELKLIRRQSVHSLFAVPLQLIVKFTSVVTGEKFSGEYLAAISVMK